AGAGHAGRVLGLSVPVLQATGLHVGAAATAVLRTAAHRLEGLAPRPPRVRPARGTTGALGLRGGRQPPLLGAARQHLRPAGAPERSDPETTRPALRPAL